MATRKRTEAVRAAQRKYDAAHTTQISLKFNQGTDADILAYLATKENRQGYIKALIRADMGASE